MSTRPLSDELALEAAQLVAKHGNVSLAARVTGMPRNTLDCRYKRAIERGLVAPVPSPIGAGYIIGRHNLRYDKNGALVSQSIQAVKDRGEVFEPREGHVIKGESAFVDADGRTVSRWIKTKEGERDPLWITEKIKEALDGYRGPCVGVDAPRDADEEFAAIIPVADPHFGLYAWAQETGADYDLKIAEEANRSAVDDLIRATPPAGTGVVLGLGDLLHADNSQNQTTRSGHALDVDTRYAKVLQTALLFMIYAVDRSLQKHGRIIVRNLPGNHDDHSAQAITLALWAWFRDHPRVTVDTDPGRFWWWLFGNNLLGATHGDKVKMEQLPLLMAASNPENWGASLYRYIMTGHIHHKSSLEKGGVIVESFQSTAARDAYNHEAGHRSGRSLSALVFHKERGEIARHKVNIG